MPAPEYGPWRNMIRRCTDPKNKLWHRYGGRGIAVCAEWRSSFAAFLAHIGPRISLKHTVDRLDNDGNYQPGNVRWATRLEQMQNSSGVRLLSAFGETHTLSEWARIRGLDRITLTARLDRWHWPLEVALSKPTRRKAAIAKSSR